MKVGNIDVYGIIYKVTNKINNKVYIGQTVQGFNIRYCKRGNGVERIYKRHKMLKEYGYGYNSYLLNSIDKYGLDSFEVNEVFDIAFSEKELNIKEQSWISIYNSYRKGYNRTLGGEGTSGFEGLKGIENPASRAVVQLDLEGVFIKKWDYMALAKEELNIHISDICGACSGSKKSAGGFVWVYFNEYDNTRSYKYAKDVYIKPVIQLTLDGEFICEYSSMTEASVKNNINIKGISKSCNKTRKSYLGSIWIFKDEYNEDLNYKYSPKSYGKSKKIYMFDNDNKLIKVFKTIDEAKSYLGCGRSAVSNMLNGKNTRVIKNCKLIYEENLSVPI